MARYRKRKVSLAKASYRQLQEAEGEALASIGRLQPMSSLELRDLQYQKGALSARIKEFDKKIEYQRGHWVMPPGLFSSLFLDQSNRPKPSIEIIYAIEEEKRPLVEKLDRVDLKLGVDVRRESELVAAQKRLSFIRKRLGSLERKTEEVRSLKNKAAVNALEKRRLGSLVKRYHIDNAECPYCGIAINGGGHADHIYPIAKGGESTRLNMVLVCAECNMKKSSLTLRAFIQRFTLNRDDIEERLEKLRKDF